MRPLGREPPMRRRRVWSMLEELIELLSLKTGLLKTKIVIIMMLFLPRSLLMIGRSRERLGFGFGKPWRMGFELSLL
jgi:hypothetical protein